MGTPVGQVGGARTEAYVGDPEINVVHRYRSGCPGTVGVFFLVLETARAYGYHCCPCCFTAQQAVAS